VILYSVQCGYAVHWTDNNTHDMTRRYAMVVMQTLTTRQVDLGLSVRNFIHMGISDNMRHRDTIYL